MLPSQSGMDANWIWHLYWVVLSGTFCKVLKVLKVLPLYFVYACSLIVF